MGVRSVCDFGYPIDICRCTQKHDPVRVSRCYSGHHHKNLYTASGPGANAVVKPVAAAEIIEKEEWQPILDDDTNVVPRSQQEAIQFYADHPPGGTYSDGEPMPVAIGLRKRTVRIEYGPWETVI